MNYLAVKLAMALHELNDVLQTQVGQLPIQRAKIRFATQAACSLGQMTLKAEVPPLPPAALVIWRFLHDCVLDKQRRRDSMAVESSQFAV